MTDPDPHARAVLARKAATEDRCRRQKAGQPVPWNPLPPEQLGPLDHRLGCGLTVAEARKMNSYDLYQLYKEIPSDQRDELLEIMDPMDIFELYLETQTTYVTAEEMNKLCGALDIV